MAAFFETCCIKFKYGSLYGENDMNATNVDLFQKILGACSALFFAYFAFSIGDDALQTSFSGVGLFLKFELLVIVIFALLGLWLLVSKRRQSLIILAVDTVVCIAAFIFFIAQAF